jgi:ubiquinone biosynthesis protein
MPIFDADRGGRYSERSMSLLDTVRDMDRLRQIAQVLVRHGFGEIVSRMGLSSKEQSEEQKPRSPLGERLRLVLQDLGPTFVKLGQILSTRSDLIPEEVLHELKKLQDQVAFFPEEEVRQQIIASLGAPAEVIFASFESQPLASASVAQVHRATLAVEGEPEPVQVAVKIQRPGIVDTVQRDLDLLYLLARLIENAIPESRVYSPTGLVREFDRSISAELDFTVEAYHASRFTANFTGESTIRFPRVFSQASGKRVLTLEYLDGLKLEEAVGAGADRKWIAHTAVRLILKMIFEDGFFHADPHPGNVLILPRPADGSYQTDQPLTIGLIDMGLVGRLSPELRDRSMDLLLAAASNDPDGIADALLAIGHSRTKVDQKAFRQHVSHLCEKHLGKPLKDLHVANIIRDILAGAIQFEIEIPVELTMMLRAIMTIEGVGKDIYPELDLFQVAKPYLLRMVWQRFHPLRMGADLLKDAGRLGQMARQVPFQLQEILEDMRQGRLRIRTADPEGRRATDRLGERIRASVISASLLGSGVVLLAVGRHESLAWGFLISTLTFLLAHLFFDFFSSRSREE